MENTEQLSSSGQRSWASLVPFVYKRYCWFVYRHCFC